MALIKGNAQQDKIQRYWYQNDQLGTPIQLTDSIGETLYQCEYNAYGQVIDEKYYSDYIDTLPDNPSRFQGQYYDEETGLHYNLNRYYDPFIGQYITQDPIKLNGGMNFYQYCSNTINWTDPLGLFKVGHSGFEAIENITKPVKRKETGIIWRKGIEEQGMPWEDFVGRKLPPGSRLPERFKTFDYYDDVTKKAISVKTLDTTTPKKIANPKPIYSTLKKNIDEAVDFKNTVQKILL